MKVGKWLQNTSYLVKHLKNYKKYVLGHIENSTNQRPDFQKRRSHYQNLARGEIFDVFLDVEKNEKKNFWKKKFLRGGRSLFLNGYNDIALWMHYENLKMVEIDQNDYLMRKRVEIEDRKI